MDNIRDRFGARDRMSAERGGRERDRYDRPERSDRIDMGERSSRRGPAYEPEGIQIDDVANIIEQSNAKQMEVFADCIDDVKDEVYTSEKEIMKAIEQIAAAKEEARNRNVNEAPPQPIIQPVIDPAMKAEIMSAIFNNTDILNTIRETLEKKNQPEEPALAQAQGAATEDAAAEAPSESDPFKTVIAEYYSNMEDHVHKENVKCYRNVQAALTEQSTQIVDQNKKSLGLIKVFAIVNLLLTVVNLALLACFIFGII